MATWNKDNIMIKGGQQVSAMDLLAEQLGKSTCSVSKWCQNTVQPDLQTLDKISRLLDVDIRELLVSTKEK